MKIELRNSTPLSTSPKTNLNLTQFNEYLAKNKPRKISENSVPNNEKLDNFLPTNSYSYSKSEIDPNLIDFTSPHNKKGFGLYKEVLPKTQLIYYDDPNELVTRLNLLISSQNAGNTGVNNEIISILEELRERKCII